MPFSLQHRIPVCDQFHLATAAEPQQPLPKKEYTFFLVTGGWKIVTDRSVWMGSNSLDSTATHVQNGEQVIVTRLIVMWLQNQDTCIKYNTFLFNTFLTCSYCSILFLLRLISCTSLNPPKSIIVIFYSPNTLNESSTVSSLLFLQLYSVITSKHEGNDAGRNYHSICLISGSKPGCFAAVLMHFVDMTADDL